MAVRGLLTMALPTSSFCDTVISPSATSAGPKESTCIAPCCSSESAEMLPSSMTANEPSEKITKSS